MNTCRYFLILVAAVLMAAFSLQAATVTNSQWASIRAGTFAATDIDENSVGYIRISYDSPIANNAGKGYFEFLVTGNPNTNADATFTFYLFRNSGFGRAKLWALDQSYGDMSQSITWAAAQANCTTNNEMWTDPLVTGFTATQHGLPLFLPDGAGTNPPVARTFTLYAPWGQHLHNGKVVLAMSGSEGNAGSAKIRVSQNPTNPPPTLSYEDITSGNPPFITILTNITKILPGFTATNFFSIGDLDNNLSATPPAASSSNSDVVPESQIFLSQTDVTGTNWAVYAAPAQGGTSFIKISITDNAGNVADRSFLITAVSSGPVISKPANTNTLNTTAVTIPFTISDNATPANSLEVTAYVQTASAALISSISTTITGANGTNRTVTVTPAPGADGVAVCTIEAVDGDGNTNKVNFAVMVLPSGLLFSDHFQYPDGDLLEVSAKHWDLRGSGGSRKIKISQGKALFTDNSTSGESLKALLRGGPINSGLIYYGFKANWSVPPVGSQYYASLLFQDGSSTNLIGRAYASSTNYWDLSTYADNQFAAVAGYSTQPFFPMAQNTNLLSSNVTYRIVVRYNPADDGSSLDPELRTHIWVNPTSETDHAGIAQDGVSAAIPPTHMHLRMTGFNGQMMMEDLKVGTNFNDVLPSETLPTAPVITSIQFTATNKLQLDFTAAAIDIASEFGLQRATTVGGIYEPATFQVTITQLAPGSFRAVRTFMPGDEGYFRISRLGF